MPEDAVFGRMGGEEFAATFLADSPNGALPFVQKIQTTISGLRSSRLDLFHTFFLEYPSGSLCQFRCITAFKPTILILTPSTRLNPLYILYYIPPGKGGEMTQAAAGVSSAAGRNERNWNMENIFYFECFLPAGGARGSAPSVGSHPIDIRKKVTWYC